MPILYNCWNIYVFIINLMFFSIKIPFKNVHCDGVHEMVLCDKLTDSDKENRSLECLLANDTKGCIALQND